MRIVYRFTLLFILGLSLIAAIPANAKTTKTKKARTGSIYFSWGYNSDFYTNSTIHVKQGALGNDYQLVSAEGHDHKGWNTGVLNKALSIPQYNYRLGYYFGAKQKWGFEINFDHTKYIIDDNQDIRIKGTLNNQHVDQNINYSYNNGFYYFLNNGANFLCFNLVRRWGLYQSCTNNFRLDLVGKVGAGPVVPHVENEFFGKENLPHFQLGGWNMGAETALRATFWRYGFLEFSQKYDYARYSQLKIYEGKVHQAFGCYELILSAGFILPTTKHNAMFERRHKVRDAKMGLVPYEAQ